MHRIVLFLLLLTGCALSTAPNLSKYTQIAHASDGSRVMGLVEHPPMNIHSGVWYDTASCLGIFNPPPPTSIFWATADTLITPEGYLAYGMTVIVNGVPKGIVVEADFWHFPAVLSHEAIHALTGRHDHFGPAWACQMISPVDLPLRRYEPAA